MELIRTASAAVARLAQGLTSDFSLVDVGCSGGVDPGWRSFGERLSAVGFDIATAEVFRLNQTEASAKVRYFAANIRLPDEHPFPASRRGGDYWRRNPWANLSVSVALRRLAGEAAAVPAPERVLGDARPGEAALDAEIEAGLRVWTEREAPGPAPLSLGRAGRAEEAALMRQNRWGETENETLPVSLKTAISSAGLEAVDFLKMDIDGGEYELLSSLGEGFADLSVLGVGVEVNFFGAEGPHHNTFHAIDRLMRRHGFTLFGLTVRSYSAAALPAPFVEAVASPSTFGRPLQGDALYVRDPYMADVGFVGSEITADRALKLAAIFCLFHLPDQAADVLLRARPRLEAAGFDVGAVLDLLAVEAQGDRLSPWSYAEYMQAFGRGDPWFYGARGREAAAPVVGSPEVDRLNAEMAAMRASTSWRLTAPLRALIARLRG